MTTKKKAKEDKEVGRISIILYERSFAVDKTGIIDTLKLHGIFRMIEAEDYHNYFKKDLDK
jgi:hypothetical protein